MLRNTTFTPIDSWLERDLETIDRTKDSSARIDLCVRLLAQLVRAGDEAFALDKPTAQLNQGLTSAEQDQLRATVLKTMPWYLIASNPEQLAEILEIALSIKSEWYRADVLAAMVPHVATVAPELLSRILKATTAILYEASQFKLLVALASESSGQTYLAALSRVLRTIQLVANEQSQVDLLLAIAPLISGRYQDLQPTFLAAIETLESDKLRAIASVQVAPYLSGPEQTQVLDWAIAHVESIEDEGDRADVLVEIAPKLSKLPYYRLEHILEIALSLQDDLRTSAEENARLAAVLQAITPDIAIAAPHLLSKVKKRAKEIFLPQDRASVLCAFIKHLQESERKEGVEQALQATLSIPDENGAQRVERLGDIVPYLANSDRAPVVAQMIQIMRSLPNRQRLAQVFRKVVPVITDHSPDQLDQLLHISLLRLAGQDRADVSAMITARLARCDEAAFHKAEQVAASILDPGYRSQVLIAIFSAAHGQAETAQENAARLSRLEHEVLRTQFIEDSASKHRTQMAIAPYLANGHPHLLRQVFEDAMSCFRLSPTSDKAASPQSTASVSTKPGSLREKAHYLLEQLHDESPIFRPESETEQTEAIDKPQAVKDLVLEYALEALSGIVYEGYRAEAMTKLVSYLSSAKPELLARYIQAAHDLSNKWSRAQALGAVAKYLEPSKREALLEKVVQDIQSIEYVESRANALAEVITQLGNSTPDFLQLSFQLAEKISEERYRVQVLAAIASQLIDDTDELVTKLLRATRTMAQPQHQACLLRAIANQLPQLATATPDLVEEMLRMTQAIAHETDRAHVLAAIGTQLPQLADVMPYFVVQTIQATQLIRQEAARTDALIEISKQLPQRFLPQLIDATSGLSEAKSAQIFSSAAKHFPEWLAMQLPDYKHLAALETIEQLEDDADKTALLGALSPHLSIGLFQNALYRIQTLFKQDSYRVDALSNLITYLPTDQLPLALKIITQDIQILSYQTKALEALIPHLPARRFRSILTLVEQNYVEQPQLSARILLSITTEFSQDPALRPVEGTAEQSLRSHEWALRHLANKVLELTRERLIAPETEKEAACILSHLAVLPQLSDAAGNEIAEAGRALTDLGYRCQVLRAIAPYNPTAVRSFISQYEGDDYLSLLGIGLQLSALPRERALVSVMETLNSIEGDYRKTAAWVAIAEKIGSPDCQSDTLQAIRNLDNTHLKAQHLQQLVPHLLSNQRLEAANIIREMSDPYYRVRTFVSLACKFPEFRSEAKNIAQQTLEDNIQKIEQLSLLAIEVPEILPEIVDITERLEAPLERREALISLAPHLPMRINRAVERECSDNYSISTQLWERALYLLSRGYRDAIEGGSLRNDSTQDKDFLNIQDEINALANLLLMRDLDPPMAVGILGGWGGGKSYIMHLMQTHMTQVRNYPITEIEAWNPDPKSEKLSPYVGHIYQIKFDAWTFAKSDLWASLMQTIFFELDRQLTLEAQITEVLNEEVGDVNQRRAIEHQIWPVLYKTNDDEREWFLRKVLTDSKLLEALTQKQKSAGSAGVLWKKFQESQTAAISRLEATKTALEEKQAELETVKSQLRTQVRQEFKPIFNLSNNRSFQRVDAFLGTSFSLLRRRIGQDSFEKLSQDIAERLFETADEPGRDRISQGLWKQLEEKLETLEAARKKLEDLEVDSQTGDLSSSDGKSSQEGTHEDEADCDLGNRTIEMQQQRVNRLLREVSEIRFDIFNVAATVIERRSGWLNWQRNLQWMRSNWLLLLLFAIFFLIPVGFGVDLYVNIEEQGSRLIAKVAALVAPILPSITILQNLIGSGQKWFEETHLALNEYKVSVEKRNKELETAYERVMQQSLESNPRLRQLTQEVQALEQDYEAQQQAVPINQYSTLSAFVRDRLDSGTYAQRLGPMQQVKQDLADLSNKLLPPSQYDQRFQTKIDFLKSVFPRGPARVAVYIDDLDRCPPDRVVQVLEAVQLLIKTPLFIAVLAVDERYITRALEKFYSGILLRNGSPSGTDYLEKIIQLPYRVRPIMANTLETYLRSQIIIQDNAAGVAKFSEFSRHEFDKLLACCHQIDLSPRTIKRLTNVYKLFKIVCRTRGNKPTPQVQQAILALLALSGRYPQLMRGIFNNIQNCFEEQRTKEKAKARKNPFHLELFLKDFFKLYNLPIEERHLNEELDKLKYDAVETNILPERITLNQLSQEIFNLIRSFSFVGDIGQDPVGYADELH